MWLRSFECDARDSGRSRDVVDSTPRLVTGSGAPDGEQPCRLNQVSDNARVDVLTYHHVGEFARPKYSKGIYCHVSRFRDQMWFLHNYFTVIDIQTAYEGLFLGRPLPRRAVVLTFDDGYQDFYDYAWPVLQEYRLPATVFMVSERIGRIADWVSGEKAQSAALMGTRTLRELAAHGITIGSHTATHPHLSALCPEAQQQELCTSKQRLEDLLGLPVQHLCYPYGDYNQATPGIAEAAGYLTGFSTRRAGANFAPNAFQIPRQSISYKDTLVRYIYKILIKNRIKERQARQ